MNPLSTLRVRRLARPHLLALAAVLALPATVGAQATNNWRCAGGGWNGDPVCWSLGTPNSTQNVVIPAGPAGSDLILLTAIGNNVSMRQLTVGGERTEPSSSATAYLYASGSTINVNGSSSGPGNVNVGYADNANAQLTLTNNSTLNLGQGGGFSRGAVFVGKSFGNAFSNVQLGIGTLAVQGNSRINGSVFVNNGRLDISGSSDPGYVAISGDVILGNTGPSLGVASNIAGSVTDLRVRNARANIGVTSGNLAAPSFNSIGADTSGVADFVGRSVVNNLQARSGGVVNINGGASVEAANPTIFADGKLTVQSGGSLSTYVLYNNQGGNVDLSGGTINHRGIDNAGTVSGTGVIDSVLETQTFKQQATGRVQASGGDLTFVGRFDGSAGGTIGTQNGRLYFYGDALFKAGQVITQSGTGGLIAFSNKVEIGNATQRGSLEAMVADIALQGSSNLFLDFGDSTDHDYLSTGGGLLVEGGKLTLSTAGSFQAGLGSFYNVFRATSGITGTFSSIDTTAFALAPGARLDMSNLYTTGTLAVVAVPEPATWLSLGAGLLLIGARARRWRQEA